MARIAGIDLPRTKRVEIGLTHIYGIGRTRSMSILMRAGVSPDKEVKDLTDDEITHIRQIIEEEGAVEGDLRKEVNEHKAPDRDRFLPRLPPPAQPARARPENAYERAHAQGTAQRNHRE